MNSSCNDEQAKIDQVTALLIGTPLKLDAPVKVVAGGTVTITVPVLYSVGGTVEHKKTFQVEREGFVVGVRVFGNSDDFTIGAMIYQGDER